MFRCDICSLSVNSKQQLAQHLLGDKHRKKAQEHQFNQTNNVPAVVKVKENPLPLLVGKHGGRFVKAGVQNSSGAFEGDLDGPNAEPENDLVGSSAAGLDRNVTTSGMTDLTTDLRSPLKRKFSSAFFCDSCNLEFNSQSQANAHFSGSKHAKKQQLFEQGDTTSSLKELNNTDTPQSAAVKCKSLPTIICDICKAEFNSQSQAEAHFKGSKHAKKKQLFDQGGNINVAQPVLKQGTASLLFCTFCNIGVNSTPQMEVHRSGSKHKANVDRCSQLARGLISSTSENISWPDVAQAKLSS